MHIARSAAAFVLAVALAVGGPAYASAAGTEPPAEVSAIVLATLAKPMLTPEQDQLRLSLERQLTAAQLTRLQPAIAALRAVFDGRKTGNPSALASQGARTAFPNAGADDVDALICIVMSEAAAGAGADLKAAMAQILALTLEKPGVQQQPSQMEQLQMQSLMMTYTQIQQIVSNIMRSDSDTKAVIIQNL